MQRHNVMDVEDVTMRLDDRTRAEDICRSAARMAGRSESGDLTISFKEAEALVKSWAEDTIYPDFGAFVTGCVGGLQEKYDAYDHIDDIARLFGAAVVREWFDKGIDEFASRQDPTLWHMYQNRIEPARDKTGCPLEPFRPAAGVEAGDAPF
jgi:hypothetical protein